MAAQQKAISLSSHLGLTRKKLEKVGVFDSTLGIDTKLFIEPKLIVKSKVKEFKKSRIKILQYFAKLIKIHRHSTTSLRLLEIAKEMLAVPEPIGLSIGYGNKTDRGTAIAETLADRILLSLSEILSVGIDDEELVEILGLFVKGFGPDSISDLTVSIIYEDFCLYTERLAKKLKVKTKPFSINGKKYNLPQHPFKKTQIIFVPHELLSPLPIAVSWDEIAAASERSRRLRREFNEILIPTLKETLRDVKAKKPEEIKEFKIGINKLLDIYRSVSVKPYSLKSDEKGYYGIRPFVELESGKIKASTTPATFEELVVSVRDLIGQYQRSIEQNGGNKILFRRDRRGKIQKDNPHNEYVSQILSL